MSKGYLTKSMDELRDLCQPTKCGVCQTTLRESTTGMRNIGDSSVCSDYYFEAFAEEIEKHPIGTPRSPRTR
jgi:hypothetical protein